MLKFSRIIAPILLIYTINQSHAENLFDSNSPYLLGDWQGKRTELVQKGVKFEANLRTDTAYLADGGYDAGAGESSQQLSLGTTIDFEKLLGWDGWTFNFLATARRGNGTSAAHISDPSAPMMSNVQSTFGRGNQDSRLSTLTIEKTFKTLGLSIKAGRMGMGADFDYLACEFQNLAFCAAQMGKWQNSIWKNAPAAQWALRVKYKVAPEWTASLGVYEFNPDDGNAKAEGQGWSLDSEHADGVTIPFELMWQPKLFKDHLSGVYRFGAMYNTSDDPINQKDIATGAPEDRSFGGWVAIEQQLTQHGSGKQGLHGFANFTWHDRITTKVDNSQQFGFKYYGLWNAQPDDFLGFGANRAHLNERFVQAQNAKGKHQFNGQAEYNIELNYSYNATKWLLLIPNIQYIVHPGGTRNVNNALVLGLDTKLYF